MIPNPSDAPTTPQNHLRTATWLLGTAAAGVGATAEAGTVQIDLTGNGATFIANTLDDQTYRDLTGDGIDDLVGSNGLSMVSARADSGLVGRVAGVRVGASFTSYYSSSSSTTESTFYAFVGSESNSGGNPVSARKFIPVTFTDARINGGIPTEALIEVFAHNVSASSHEIQLVRLVFDDANFELQEEASLTTEYPQWYDVTVRNTPIPISAYGNASKLRLKRQIAGLEALIRKVKADAQPRTPRMQAVRMNPATLRYLASLERRLAALMKQLRRL